jgi:hypothetical protein
VPGDVVYGIGFDHAGYLEQGDTYIDLGGYVQG